jgi:hypothetical protein
LLVEFWCAYSLPFASVLDFRQQLSGADSKVFLRSCRPERDDGKEWTVEVKDDPTGNPKPLERKLETWPINCMWQAFLKAMDMEDSACVSAADQYCLFTDAKKWVRYTEQENENSLV